jgi:DNA invertase Pin-like site-specific DNA recombinase
MMVGWCRLSEHERPADLDGQRRLLTGFGCEKLFVGTDVLKGRQRQRDACLAFLREGDCLVATKPDRLVRTPTELLRMVDALTKRGIGLVVLNLGGPMLDTRDPRCASDPLMVALRGVVAWDRAIHAELQRAGVRRGQAAGRYLGSKPSVPIAAVRALAAQDGMAPSAIARVLKISVSSVRRALPEDYRVEPKPKRVPRERLDARTIQVLLAAGAGPTAIARSLGCSRSSVRRLGAVHADIR